LPGLTVLAIDLGGTHAACAVVRDGEILASKTVAADRESHLEPLLPVFRDALSESLHTAHLDTSACSALVLAFPGIVSARENRVLATNAKFDDAPKLDLKAWSKDAFGVPFLIENDARLALLGEHSSGAARGADDAVMITLGSGVGGATLLDGRPLQSAHGLAGTIGGHIPVVFDGALCSCGNRGCADAEASTAALPLIYRRYGKGSEGTLRNEKRIGFAELFQAAEAHDEPAVATLEHCLRVWSALTVALIHAYDPEVVVFGGSVMKRAADILPRLQDYVKVHAWTPGRTVPLRAAELGSDAALLGAVALAEYSL
jgi:glucokinase